MDFFNDLGKKIGKTAKTVSKKSEGLVEVTKLNLSIGNEEDKIKKMLIEIGSEIYGKFAEGEHFDQYVDDKCTQIKQVESNILELRNKVMKIKGHKTCPGCNTDIEDEVKFCPNCGSKTEE